MLLLAISVVAVVLLSGFESLEARKCDAALQQGAVPEEKSLEFWVLLKPETPSDFDLEWVERLQSEAGAELLERSDDRGALFRFTDSSMKSAIALYARYVDFRPKL